MLSCLGDLGIQCVRTDSGIRIGNDITTIIDRTYDLDANLSGTTIRFILALSCVVPGIKVVHGRGRLNERPIGDLVEGLQQLGARMKYSHEEGLPPVRVLSSRLSPGTMKMNGKVSSQYFSAVLMIAPAVGEVTVEVVGEQISKPYIDMTIDIMKKFGVDVVNENYRRYVVGGGQKYSTKEYVVEGDVSSASYFAAIAALTKSRITLTNMNPKSVQADMQFFKILEQMGNVITYGDQGIVVEGKGVRPVEVDMEDCPDQAQTLAVFAAFADGVTKITGLQSLRVKETDRIAAPVQELTKMGIRAESTADSLTIYGGNPKAPSSPSGQAAAIDTYGDHRMAMAFAVAGAKLEGVQINDPDVVNKTFPEFWDKLASIGVNVKMLS